MEEAADWEVSPRGDVEEDFQDALEVPPEEEFHDCQKASDAVTFDDLFGGEEQPQPAVPKHVVSLSDSDGEVEGATGVAGDADSDCPHHLTDNSDHEKVKDPDEDASDTDSDLPGLGIDPDEDEDCYIEKLRVKAAEILGKVEEVGPLEVPESASDGEKDPSELSIDQLAESLFFPGGGGAVSAGSTRQLPKAAPLPVPKTDPPQGQKRVQQSISAFFKIPLPKVQRSSQVDEMVTASQPDEALLADGVLSNMKGGSFDSSGKIRRNKGGRPKMDDADKRGVVDGVAHNHLRPGQDRLKNEPGASTVIECRFGPSGQKTIWSCIMCLI